MLVILGYTNKTDLTPIIDAAQYNYRPTVPASHCVPPLERAEFALGK